MAVFFPLISDPLSVWPSDLGMTYHEIVDYFHHFKQLFVWFKLTALSYYSDELQYVHEQNMLIRTSSIIPAISNTSVMC